VPVTARVLIHLKRIPERYKLVEPLIDILDMKEDTRTGIITALWHYIKVNGLQDKVDRRIIRPDAKLRPVSTQFRSCEIAP
jgi:SWI/SNF-related matrix-associated actin-dependent regulator of chromatin subfamily D